MADYRGADPIGDAPDDEPLVGFSHLGEIEREEVLVADLDGGVLPERPPGFLHEPRVDLDRDRPLRQAGEEASYRPEARADLDDPFRAQSPDELPDRSNDLPVDEEILAEPLARPDPGAIEAALDRLPVGQIIN